MTPDFVRGLVFGFDVGTGSIGYAVRRGAEFLDAGVLICDNEASDLSKRRELRRQRRTLRSKKYRRQWLARELEKLGLTRPAQQPHDPITLRVRALQGEELDPGELHAALTHLFRRRGYTQVPWANSKAPVRQTGKAAKEDEEGQIKAAVAHLRATLGTRHPCQFLAEQRAKAGKHPTSHWARKIYWPREALRDEFLAIVAAQRNRFPKLAEKTDWLLHGGSQPARKGSETFHVFHNATDARNPGVLGLRWPRFDNRGPALDSLQPMDPLGRPLHVIRKNKAAYVKAQWEIALMNFRVLDPANHQKRDPRTEFPAFVESLRTEWNKRGKVTLARLRKLAEPFQHQLLLLEDQKPLTPDTGAGRARYSKPTLDWIRDEIGKGHRLDPPQPVLQRPGENASRALDRYLAEIKHPVVKHRLVLFRRILSRLISQHGQPDLVVLEAVRSLALGVDAKNELKRRNEQFRLDREQARQDLAGGGESTTRKAIQRYRLWKEAGARCPFCLQSIERTDLGHGADIEHIVPRACIDSNEFSNLTVAHAKCNRELKRDRTPFAAFGATEVWEGIKANAEKHFHGLKLQLLLSPTAENLIQQKTDLQHTAYIARVIRHVTLIQLGWLNDSGRDPTPDRQNHALRFQVTNGQLTSRLRKAWGLNHLLHPLPPGRRWEDLTGVEQAEFANKNRGDLRHHALDAMVIATTLPWLAHRTHGATDELGRHGWWTQDEKLRSKAANPVFPGQGQMHDIVRNQLAGIVVQHHVSRSSHQQAYATTLYARKADDTYAAREVFISLKPKDLKDIWPQDFAAYVIAAWACYVRDAADLEHELKGTKDCLPENFTRRLCFSHFQKTWRSKQAPAFEWPCEVRIPIRSVRLISVKTDSAVVPFSPGTHAYVKRIAYKEVQIFLAEDGKSFVPVFIPCWRRDIVEPGTAIQPGVRPLVTIRRGMVVETRKPFSTGHPPGKYRVIVTGQNQIRLLPHHVADQEEAILSFGLRKKGLQPYWPDFIRALGYELPHPPPVESRPQSPDPA